MNAQTTIPITGHGVSLRADHRLSLVRVDLLGGGRAVDLRPDLNFIRGDITTGKTTFVRLVRAMLSTVPSALPPEIDAVRAVQGTVRLRNRLWRVYRPLTTTREAPIEIAAIDESMVGGDAERLQAQSSERTYSKFLLDNLGLPSVSVPEGSTTASRLNPITISDWLGYCIVTGDELDSNVFGHMNVFRDRKRRWVFQLIYGYYDADYLNLIALHRGVELRLDALDQEAEIIQRFLAQTPFADRMTLETLLMAKDAQLREVQVQRNLFAQDATSVPEVSNLRVAVLAARERLDALRNGDRRLAAQLSDLSDLERQLISQSAKLTRAIVSDELLVDFDFMVCPRCGTGVDSHDSPQGTCYLCHQQEHPGTALSVLLAEQDRVASQIVETRDVVQDRLRARESVEMEMAELEAEVSLQSRALNDATSAFISDNATALLEKTRIQTKLETEIEKLKEYNTLLSRSADHALIKAELENQLEALTLRIESKSLELGIADANVNALETRMLEYLRALRIPQFADSLTVSINRTTYLPEISGRTFDELSSQGLKTLVNIAHALAHHTVAIDRSLPLPGLILLDGLSANTGREGFDQARIEDIYRLLIGVSKQYGDSLQIIAVDNDIPPLIVADFARNIVMTLSQDDRLIRPEPANPTIEFSPDPSQ